MAIKRRGIIAVPGEYRYGEAIEVKTAEELRAAAERQPIIMLTRGHPPDGVPRASDAIGTVSQKWDEEHGRVNGEFWFHDEKIPESIRAKIVNNEPVAISPGFVVDSIDAGVQKGIVYTHLAVLEEEDPRCPLGTCGVNLRMDAKDGTARSLRLDQKTELAPVEASPVQPERAAKVAEQKPEPKPPEPETKAPPAEQKPETKTEVEAPKKEPAPEVQRAPEVVIPTPETTAHHEFEEVGGGWVKYVPKPYRTKEAT